MTAYEMRIIDWSSDVCSSDPATRGPEPAEAFYAELLAGRDEHLSPAERAAVRSARAMGEDPRGLAAGDAPGSEVKGQLSDVEIRTGQRRVGIEGVSTCYSGVTSPHSTTKTRKLNI